MYSEKTFKNYIFWIQVRRFVIIVALSILGAAIGILIGKILETALQTSNYNNYAIIIPTVLFFILSVLLTTSTGKDVQDAYWKIAVLRKLTVIQKDLELSNGLILEEKMDNHKTQSDIMKELNSIDEDSSENTKMIKAKKKALIRSPKETI